MAAAGTIPLHFTQSLTIYVSCTGTFVLLHALGFLKYIQVRLSSRQFRQLFTWLVVLAAALVFLGVVGLTYAGVVAPWSGRFYSLYDTGWVHSLHV